MALTQQPVSRTVRVLPRMVSNSLILLTVKSSLTRDEMLSPRLLLVRFSLSGFYVMSIVSKPL